MNIVEQWKVLNESRNTLPVPVFKLPEKLGIKLNYAFLSDDISGMLETVRNAFILTVNASDFETRQRFTLAHELGHYMLHRPLIGSGLDDDRAYRSTDVGKYHNTRIGMKEEREANRFAANLLMPDKKVIELKKDISDPEKLAREFGVSLQAMNIRLSSLG